MRILGALLLTLFTWPGTAETITVKDRAASQNFTHERLIGSPGRDPFSYHDSMMVMFVPRGRLSPQIAVGIKCFDDGYSILTVGMIGYENFAKDPDGYSVSFKVNAGAILNFHMSDSPRNSGVITDSREEPRVRELLGRFLDADSIAIAFRGEAYLLTMKMPDSDARKMMKFCGPTD